MGAVSLIKNHKCSTLSRGHDWDGDTCLACGQTIGGIYRARIAELEKAAQRVLDGIVERGGTLVMLNSNDAIDALAALLLEE